jgi:sterol desaturase/sphingolipid hydroxylase (fatty acid hydroxylase superfamily)
MTFPINFVKEILLTHVFLIQLVLYAATIIGLWLAEALILAETFGVKCRCMSINMFFVAFTLPVQLIFGVLLVKLTHWTGLHHCGLIYILPSASNPWIKYGLMFLVLDFLDYIYHNIMHKVPIFWRFHLVHHTDNRIDVATTLREHPGETILRNSFLMCWVLLCGASPGVLILRQTAQTLFNVSSHSSFRLPPYLARSLGWVIVTPNFHHLHHHFRLPYTDRNYGDNFAIWDRLFGTFAERSTKEIIFGLDSYMTEDVSHPLALINMPFRNLRRNLRLKLVK